MNPFIALCKTALIMAILSGLCLAMTGHPPQWLGVILFSVPVFFLAWASEDKA